MGYSANWLTHEGAIAVHNEIALAAFDREVPHRPLRLLLVGIGNGGAVEVWKKSLPDGAEIFCMDNDPACSSIIGIDPIICDVTDKYTLRAALRGMWFDCIIDSTGTMSSYTWPFLAPGGTLHYETYDPEQVFDLVKNVAHKAATWLPVEEVLRVDVYSDIVVIEKRNPIVIPPVTVLTGNFADRVPESELMKRGIKRAMIQ